MPGAMSGAILGWVVAQVATRSASSAKSLPSDTMPREPIVIFIKPQNCFRDRVCSIMGDFWDHVAGEYPSVAYVLNCATRQKECREFGVVDLESTQPFFISWKPDKEGIWHASVYSGEKNPQALLTFVKNLSSTWDRESPEVLESPPKVTSNGEKSETEKEEVMIIDEKQQQERIAHMRSLFTRRGSEKYNASMTPRELRNLLVNHVFAMNHRHPLSPLLRAQVFRNRDMSILWNYYEYSKDWLL